jgi:hypothetical protein
VRNRLLLCLGGLVLLAVAVVGGLLLQRQLRWGDETRSPAPSADAARFDPKLRLEWPAPPSETRRRIDAGSPDETTIYSASLVLTDPATIFSATVHQFTEASLPGKDPRVMVAEHALQGDEGLDRKISEYVANKAYETNKFPGVEVTAKSGNSFARRVVVLAGTRLYKIEAVSTKEDRLKAADVARFFDSFEIQE